MKSISLMLLAFCLSLACFAQTEFEYQSLTITPAKPSPGDKIHFFYHPKYTLPKNRSKLEAEIMYINTSTNSKMVMEYPDLVRTDVGWEGNYQTSKETRALKFSFNNHFPSWEDTTGLIYDPNMNEGYLVPFYNNQGTVLPGAWIDMATCLFQINNDEKKLRFAKKEKELNGLFNEGVEDGYLKILLTTSTKSNSNEKEVRYLLDQSLRAGIPNEKRYSFFINIYKYGLKENGIADSLMVVRNRLYPNGEWTMQDPMMSLFQKSPTGIDSMILLYNRYKNQLLADGKTEEQIDAMENVGPMFICVSFGRQERWPEFYKWLEKCNSGPNFQLENGIVSWLMQNGKKDSMVLFCSARGHAEQKAYVEDRNPKWLAEERRESYRNDIRQDRELKYAIDSKNYIELLLANGKGETAKDVAREVMEITNGEDLSINEIYARAMSTSDTPQKTLTKLETFFKNGKGSSAMKEPMLTLWVASGYPATEFEPHFDSLNNYLEIQLQAKLRKDMINEPAPLFALKNLNGQEISLTSLKGKPVVLDFWATWCGPCKASMPAMQKAMEDFSVKKTNAVFLFADTWENQPTEEQREKDVARFINEKKYPFNVLFDKKEKEDYLTVSAYKVQGIPTKFIIDSKGNIRFKVTGFGNNEDEVIKSIALMIKMAEEQL